MKALVIDNGLYLYLAEKLAETWDKVWYCCDTTSPYPKSHTSQIGQGLENVQRVRDPWQYFDQADVIVFFDCYDGELQHWLRHKGYTVFGAGRSEKMELDKVFFLDELTKAGLPVPRTYLAEGLDDLCNYLQDKTGEKWLKTSYYRGDFETHKFRGARHMESWIDDLKHRLGRRANDIEVLVQDPIKAACETGYDGFCIDGQFTDHALIGYEIKDKGYVGKVFAETPAIIAGVNEALAPLYKRLGYRGHYSTEIRITPGGKPFFIDPTCRAPSPPAEAMCELYANYAEAVLAIAKGQVPTLKPKGKYVAEIILNSAWHEANHELHVDFPEKIAPYVKLKNHTCRRGKYYCVPNDNGGFFGAVVCVGDSLDEVMDTCQSYFDQIECDELDKDDSVFCQAREQIKKGEAFDISFA